MQNIRNIIFDYGNVIFAIDFKRTQKAFRDLGISEVEKLYAHLGQDTLFDDFDKGLVSAAGFREGIRRLARRPDLEDEQIDRAWNALLIGVPEGNHELLLQYKASYRTFLLSNNNAIHYAWIQAYLLEMYGLDGNSGFFEKDYYSHLMGMRKPDPDIFEFVLQAEGLNPQETLFIDDSPQHLATAASLGMLTELVRPGENLTAVSKRLGLISLRSK